MYVGVVIIGSPKVTFCEAVSISNLVSLCLACAKNSKKCISSSVVTTKGQGIVRVVVVVLVATFFDIFIF